MNRAHRPRIATTITMSATLATSLLFAASAHADTIWREAESIRDSMFGGTITSPLQIKESSAASNGGFVEVQSGQNSNTVMPAPGKVCYPFSLATASTSYRIWTRVIAATTNDDSFWVQMDNTTPINWQLALGSAWHWTRVQKSGATTAATFNLAAGDHTLCIGYREDGAKLDALVITSDAAFNPASPAGAPLAPAGAQVVTSSGKILVSWTVSPGATSYRLERRQGFGDGMGNFPPFAPITTIAGDKFSYLDTPAAAQWNCYQVFAVNAQGESPALMDFPCGDATFQPMAVEAETFSLTAPMRQGLDFDQHSIIEVAPGNNSTAAAPASGYARYDFRYATSHTVKVWGMVVADTNADDSFWVRMDFGPWINWNNWKIPYHTFCVWDDVHNSNTDSKPMVFNLAAGNHTLEFAYREDGAQLDKVLITDDMSLTMPGCYD